MNADNATYVEAVNGFGYAAVPQVVAAAERGQLIAEIDAGIVAAAAGTRSLAQRIPAVRAFAESPAVRALVTPLLGAGAKLVRSVLFNKDRATNWQVSWHQDLSIAVKRRVDTPGFSRWTNKEGIPHVQPPVAILTAMLTVRVHLDDADAANGALWVVPCSHLQGRLDAERSAALVAQNGKVLCAAQAGDALVLRPLILHASYKATSARPRRVIHFEFAAGELPAPLAWCE